MSEEPVDVSALATIDQLLERYPFLTERWLRSMLSRHGSRAPRLRSHRLGGRVLVDPADLEALIRKR
jgi:hypothetical protein